METDFLVIGGGIGGAVFAELVARGGKRVMVLGKTIVPKNWVRPEILWPLQPKFPFVTSELLQQTQTPAPVN